MMTKNKQFFSDAERKRRSEAAKTHGMTGTPEWFAWRNMRNRCGRPEIRDYASYGGRGITVCERWRSFENFYADMGPRPSPKHSLDRMDVNGNYEPSNCRWATAHEQQVNTRKNVPVTYQGETHTIGEWAYRYGIDRSTLRHRLHIGWDMKRALTASVEDQTGVKYTYMGKTQSISAWAKEFGLSRYVLKHRIQRSKWPIEKALTTPITPPSRRNQVSKDFKPGYSTRWHKPSLPGER